MNSHVLTSKARKTITSKPTSALPPPPSSAQSASLFSRISNTIFGASGDTSAETGASGVEKKTKSEESKRSYGFATKNLALYSDKNSEDLYRLKNLSSDYMRSSIPTRGEEEEEDKPTGASSTGPFINVKEDNDNSGESDEETTSSSKPKSRRPKKK